MYEDACHLRRRCDAILTILSKFDSSQCFQDQAGIKPRAAFSNVLTHRGIQVAINKLRCRGDSCAK
jgi:hypothetical protein